jgi:hypothetical protein
VCGNQDEPAGFGVISVKLVECLVNDNKISSIDWWNVTAPSYNVQRALSVRP